jgi:hypothetical protein
MVAFRKEEITKQNDNLKVVYQMIVATAKIHVLDGNITKLKGQEIENLAKVQWEKWEVFVESICNGQRSEWRHRLYVTSSYYKNIFAKMSDSMIPFSLQIPPSDEPQEPATEPQEEPQTERRSDNNSDNSGSEEESEDDIGDDDNQN